jgi:hypothetical protein
LVRCFTVACGSRLLPHGGNYRPGPSRVAKRTGGLRTGTKPAVHPFRRRRHGRMSRANVGGFMRIKLLSPAPRVDRADGDQIGSRTTQSGAAAASGLPHKAGIQTSSDPCERLSASKTFAFPNRPLCRSQNNAFLTNNIATAPRRQSCTEAAAGGTETRQTGQQSIRR